MGVFWLITRAVQGSLWVLLVAASAAVLYSLLKGVPVSHVASPVLAYWLVTALFTAFVEGVLLWTHARYDAFLVALLRQHPRSRWLQYVLVSRQRALYYASHAGTTAELHTLLAREVPPSPPIEDTE